MNYEEMLERLTEGLVIIENNSGDIKVVAHSYMIAFPQADYDDYSDNDVEDLEDMGWGWSDDFCWTFPVLA